MIKKIATLSLLVAGLCSQAQAQKYPIKFGVHIDPGMSLMGSNEKKVTSDGVIGNFRLGVELEFYFNENDNYGLSLGANFSTGNGGKLKYAEGGRILRNSEFDLSAFSNNAGSAPLDYNHTTDAQRGVFFSEGTVVRYAVNYVEIPIGLKLRTNKLGETPLRAFFHIPVVTPMIGISARGNISAPAATSAPATDIYGGESKKENIYSDVNFFQIGLGTGAGIEFMPSGDDGLRLVAGFYYTAGLLDVTKKVNLPTATLNDAPTTTEEKNPRTGFHNIGLRIGVIF
jgi:hypothetical protein